MKKTRKIGLVSLALLVMFSVSGIASLYKPAVVRAQINLSDSAVPQGTNDEVAWWVNRYTLVLFNSTLPGDKSANAAITLSSRTQLKPVPQGGTVTYYSTGSCQMRVAYPNPSTVPTSGTLVNCDNADTSVRLEKRENGKIDGYYKKAESGQKEQITMPIYVGHLDACGSDGAQVDVDNNDYKVDGVFEKIGQNDLSGQRYNATWWLSDSSGGTRVRLRQVDTSKNPITAQQFAYCPDGDFGYLGYGSSGNTDSAQGSDYGRVVYFEKNKTYNEVFNSISADAKAYNTQALKQAEFIKFFSDPNMMNIVRLCSGKLSSTPSDLKQYAIDTLIKPIPGPFSDCLRDNLGGKTSSTGQSFDSIDSIQAADTVGAPDPAAAAGGDCGGGIPIISDLICNLVKWAFNVIFDVFTGVVGVLTNPPAVLNGQDTSLDKMWASLRNIANILFLLSFLLVVFQYITNYNVADAYFVKKFVPRLVVAVILVQASGWITRELVYFFDDLGNSIQPILFSAAGITRGNGFSIQGGAATVAFFANPAIIGILAVFAIVFLIVLVITVLVLALRYVAILVLAIFAPLAFACLSMPQLEGTFKKWLKTFVQLLAMHPIIMLMLAASSIVGSVLNGGGVILQLMALIVQFAPFIVIPFTFKFAGGLMGSVTAKLQGFAKQQGKKAYDNSQFGMRRAKEKELKRGIKSDRAGNSASESLVKKMNAGGVRGRFNRAGIYGARSTEDERSKYTGVFEDRENKRKADEARSALANRVSKLDNRDDVVAELDRSYRDAMSRGDTHAANAAYESLVGQKATKQLTAIQDDAVNPATGWDVGTYNRQQGANYGDLSGFAPHLTGDVSVGMGAAALNAQRADNLSRLSDDQIAGIKPEAWKAWEDIDPTSAAARYGGILAKGGGSAAKLSPDARASLAGNGAVKTAAAVSDADIDSMFAGLPAGPDRDRAVAAAKAERDNIKSLL